MRALQWLAWCLLLPGWICTRADVVLDWTDLMIQAIRADNSGPTLSTRNLAILHTAIYDAVNSVERAHQPYAFLLDAPSGASAEAAVVGAAYEVMKSLYPPFRAPADDLYGRYLAGHPRTPELSAGLALGANIGRLAIESRSADGSATEVPYIPSNAPGQWKRTPPFFRPPVTPHWRYVKPFCLPALEPFVPPGPPPLDSIEYAEDLNQVRELGRKNSQTRTLEQSQIATFWSDFSYTSMPPGHWHLVATAIARTRNNRLSDNARMFALISLAQADASIVCWEAKYRYNSWRPVTAIREADRDGNPLTEADAGWESYLNSPPFPEHTSGHSTFSKATADVLTYFYGTDRVAFSIDSDSTPGLFRSFTSLAECADEVGMSRIYGGIHFMSANRDGKRTGARIASYVTGNFLLPNEELPRLGIGHPSGEGVALFAQGHFGKIFVIEGSSDLRHWTPMATNSASAGGPMIISLKAAEGNFQFYRAREP